MPYVMEELVKHEPASCTKEKGSPERKKLSQMHLRHLRQAREDMNWETVIVLTKHTQNNI